MRIHNIYCDGKNLKKLINLYERMSAKFMGHVQNDGKRMNKCFSGIILVYKSMGGKDGTVYLTEV